MSRPGVRAQIYLALKSHTLALATNVFMGGAEPGELDRVKEAFVDCGQAANGWVRINKPMPFTKWGRATRGRRLLEDFLLRHLPARRANPGEDRSPPRAR